MPYDRILDLMSPPGFPNLYVLGAYAKRLTIYSQQIRAVNLVEAIHWYRQSLKGLEVAIVGGGVAGVTAAAMAIRHGAHVTLIERLQNILEIQIRSDRWLHPTIYEWPFSNFSDNETALPVMNWTANTATKMAEVLLEEWEKYYAKKVVQKFDSEVVEINPSSNHKKTTLHWQKTTVDKTAIQEQQGEFDQVIFAVGFGLEPKGFNRKSYWEKDSLDQNLRGEEYTLIAGYGDGALTDLMRACLNQFDHGELLTQVIQSVDEQQLEQLKKIEMDAKTASDLGKAYGELRVFSAIRELLAPKRNKLRKVVLAGKGPHLYDPGASALNRLITFHLLHLDAFRHIPIEPNKSIYSADRNDPVFVALEKNAGHPFTDVVLRFGAERTITKIKGIPSAIEKLQGDWAKIQPHDDPTRVRLWDRFIPISEDIDHSCVLFLAPSSDEQDLRDVIQRVIDDLKLLQLAHLSTVRIGDCFKTDESLLHTARALCRAPLAIFALGSKMGKENPGGMLLLGIRAAVKRGATLVVHEGSLEAARWGELPFNLKELQIYALDKNKDQENAKRIQFAIKEGLNVLHSDSQGYRDLPVFDIVRRPKRRTAPSPAGEREVFTLCSFDKDYEKKAWNKLRLNLQGKQDQGRAELALKRVIDYVSPLLVGERLYELIRHAGTCLIDWTGWSPNVFFEMGVRLAVNPTPPICVLGQGADEPKFASTLLARFKPLRYKMGDDKQFRTDVMNQLHSRQPDAYSVFSVAENNVSVEYEYGNKPITKQLFDMANAMVGTEDPNLRLLYERNLRLKRQIFQSSADALLATALLIDFKQQQGQDEGYSESNQSLQQILSLLLEVKKSLEADSESADLRKQMNSLLSQEKFLETLSLQSVAPAITTHQSLLRRASDLKRRSRTLRDKGDYEAAEKLLREAISLLDGPVRSSAGKLPFGIPAPEELREMATELADCWGSLGGVLRRKADDFQKFGREDESSSSLGDAFTAYKNGASLEQNDQLRIANSYNLIQRIIISVLVSPEILTSDLIKNALQNAQSLIERQIATSRSGDPWAYSDLGLVELLMGDESNANRSWDRLDTLKPKPNVYAAQLTVLENLHKVVASHDALPLAIERFRASSGYDLPTRT